MSLQLLPGIGELDKDSLCYSIYSQLYNNFFNAQDKKSPDNPYGISEGDDTSIRLRNTAYRFADAIAGAVEGGGSDGGGVLIDYLKKSGGDMSGMLRANYGFEAGIGNTRLIETYYEDERYGTRLYGDVYIGGESLFIGGRQLLRYNSVIGTATIDADIIDFAGATIRSGGEIVFGTDKANGVFLSTSTIQIKGYASGFAGAGWAILHNRTTGNVSATFDELTIRKKMRIYELEVPKAYATNGSLWISDSCSGDHVIRL